MRVYACMRGCVCARVSVSVCINLCVWVCARVRAYACVFACVSVPLRYITGVEVNPSRYTRAYQHTCVRSWVGDGTRYYNKASGKVSSRGGVGGGNDGGGVGGGDDGGCCKGGFTNISFYSN